MHSHYTLCLYNPRHLLLPYVIFPYITDIYFMEGTFRTYTVPFASLYKFFFKENLSYTDTLKNYIFLFKGPTYFNY